VATANYYFRERLPTHGQTAAVAPGLVDTGSLLFQPPETEEFRTCGLWVQFFLDQFPQNLPGIIKRIDTSVFYQIEPDLTEAPYWGVERYSLYDKRFDDSGIAVPIEPSPGQARLLSSTFDVDWPLDSRWHYCWAGIKSAGDGSPIIFSSPENPSTAAITYLHTTTPVIQSISNADTRLLSATMPSQDANKATLIMSGGAPTTITIQMPDIRSSYQVLHNGINHEDAEHCNIDCQRNGRISLTLDIPNDDARSENIVEIVKD
jgi:hypothetical protein